MSFVNDDDNKRCIIFKYEISLLFYFTYLNEVQPLQKFQTHIILLDQNINKLINNY